MEGAIHYKRCPSPGSPGARCACELIRYQRLLSLTIGILGVEVTGGIIAESLAVLADAGLVLTDHLAVVVGGIIIAFTDAPIVGPVLSLGLALLMTAWSLRLFIQSMGRHSHSHH